MTLYHKSNPSFRESILENGLLPKIGASYKCHYEENVMGAAVFVCTTQDYDTTYDDDVYEISLSDEDFEKLDFNIDKEVDNSLYTFSKIPSSFIKLIHEGTGESTF